MKTEKIWLPTFTEADVTNSISSNIYTYIWHLLPKTKSIILNSFQRQRKMILLVTVAIEHPPQFIRSRVKTADLH